MSKQPLVLIVDDEPAILQTLKASLQDEMFHVEVLADGNRAIDTIGELVPDLVLLDIFMPNCNGLKLLSRIRKEYPQQKVIIISGFGNISLAVDSVKSGALDFIEKPFNFDDILSKLTFLKCKDHKCANNQPIDASDANQSGLVGQSHLFLELLEQANKIAPLPYPVVIYGAYGTGKSRIARYIHDKSAHYDKQFISIDCSACEVLNIASYGQLDSVQSGTFFLKNIHALHTQAQRELLLFCESDFVCNNHIRIIASSCKSLYALTCAGEFSDILFNKLNSVPLEVASLSKRRYDIPLLVSHFLEQANKKYKKQVTLDVTSIRLLRNYQWYGNVAQLEVTIDRLVAQCEKQSALLLSQDLYCVLSERDISFVDEQSFLSFASFDQAILHFERQFLSYIFKKNRGDVQQTADQLQLDIFVLQEKLTQLKINLY